ncbi:MAG: leucine-rich repeat protein [Clostridia bacterium]|nr:leucine-rich repeat protein [Clostridia bacterium]
MLRKFSRLFSIVLVIVMLCPVLNVFAATEGETSGKCGDNVSWTYSNGTITISGSGDMYDYPVWDTGASSQCMPWFYLQKSVTSVIVNEGVTSIGSSSFWGIKSLKSIKLPSTLKYMGFAAFAKCTGLTDVTIPSGIIGESAFIECTNLKTVTIGNGVTASGISAFEACPNLSRVNISSLEAWCKIDFGGISANPISIARKLYLNGTLVTEINVPSGITEISAHAFEYLSDVKKVTIPSTVKTIGDYAFLMCDGMESLTLSEGIEELKASSFSGCRALKSVVIPTSVKYIGRNAFSFAAIQSVSVTRGVIDDYAFYGCGAMGGASIGSGVSYVGKDAFGNCGALKMSGINYAGTQTMWSAIVPDNAYCGLGSDVKVNFNGSSGTPLYPVTDGYVGNTFTFGRFEQDGNPANGPEPIEWISIASEDDRVLAISKDALYFVKYESTIMDNTSWETSYLRAWMNDGFYNSAFTDDEKSIILTSTLTNEANSVYGTSAGCGTTSDKIFALSEKEVNTYFNTDVERSAACSEYALADVYNRHNHGTAFRDVNTGTTYWWLRTPGVNGYTVMFVDYNGVPQEFGMASANFIVAVRPAMWINKAVAPYQEPVNTPAPVEPTTQPVEPNNNLTPVPLPTLPEAEMNGGDFVTRCYSVALGRDADDAGYSYWKDKLYMGESCGAQVGYGFIFSQEYENKNTDDNTYVTDLYTMYFGRTPDSAGFEYWTGLLASGMTREEVFAGFANSTEFCNLCNRYGVTAGYYMVGVPIDAQSGINCFVSRLYKVCLGRIPDQDGQAGWALKLLNGEVSGSTCAYGFIFGPEFTGRGLDNVAFVSYMYQAFFGREADSAGLTQWVYELDNGGSREEVYKGFAGSAEFANLCASYGITA